ncbi:GntR family transcriptional regulator [Limosilactobacillus sp. STM2_1]|uniref:GntR family transcriptional regulator n=1 Tax=Limosilactobacillus rudii TaxID=2759755 RepID=A0A7W3YLT4_9LACO|nr:GntR family transcriptional regulator [Limosilactobacillus rudii]MBB1078683.1 GntR family transcriptional regulator [Limosilactobacillus rudii]MBB1096749.1 GntR family transcriptional regulator [Limosilactobacillus rudii]MCD7135579.1 GntR family transcriptional regulator [Limosilactobacillus rudii]
MPSYSRNDLTGQAYDIILKKIIDAEYEPGQKISEKKIEDDLQIGRTPVREALLQLRQDRLINVIPQSGTYISKIDLKDVLDARFVRASVERRIMREAATIKLSTEETADLERIIENQKRTREEDNFPAFLDSDDVFHEYFYKLTNHQRVWDWLKKINIQFNRFRFLRLKVQKLSWQGLIEEHVAIYDAIKANDVNEADRLTANHMHRMLDEEESLIKSFPNYFDNVN